MMQNMSIPKVAGFLVCCLLLAGGLGYQGREARAQSHEIQVALAQNRSELTVSGGGGIRVQAGGQLVHSTAGNESVLVRRAGTQLEVWVAGERVATSNQSLTLTPASATPLRFAGATYRGHMRVHSGSSSGVTLVNVVPLEEYLYGVVACEMPASWPEDALKAQAVAARTYAVNAMRLPRSPGVFDLCCTTMSQVYGGIPREHARTTAAVNATKGEVLLHEGRIISAYYHSTSGGHTEHSEIVWTGYLGYARGVPDYDQDSPHYRWTVAWTPEDVGTLLARRGYLVGAVTAIAPAGQQGASGRWTHYEVSGTQGSARLTAERLRSALGLRSTLFEVRYGVASTAPLTSVFPNYRTAFVYGAAPGRFRAQSISSYYVMGEDGEVTTVNWPTVLSAYGTPDAMEFAGGGWGHGVGMSQYGARGMANLGYTYRQILSHFYTNTIIGTH